MAINVALPHYMYGLAERNPIIILNGRIYLVEHEITGSGKSATLISNRATNNSTQIELIESETLQNYERRFLTDNKSLIKKIIQEHVQADDSDLERKTRRAEQDLFALKERVPIIEFIYYGVFPYHLKKQKPVRKINPKSRLVEGSLLGKYISSFYSQSSQGDPYQRLLDSKSLLEEMLCPIAPLLMTKGFCYRLTTKPKSKTVQMVMLDGTQYHLDPHRSIDDIESEFLQQLDERIARVASEDTSLLDLESKLRARSDFARIIKKDHHEEGGINFLIKAGKYYVGMHVPEFTLQDSDGNFYAFNSCTVSVELMVQNGKVTDWIRPIVWETYSHPFLSNLNSSRQNICLSSAKSAEQVKADIIRDCRTADRGKTWVEHQIYLVLMKAVDTLRSGYFGDHITPYNHLNIISFEEENSRYLSNPSKYKRNLTNSIKDK